MRFNIKQKSYYVMSKNLKLFFREKKNLTMILVVPLMFYSVMGLTFGRDVYSEVNLSQYTLGYINNDVNGDAPLSNATPSIDFIIHTVNDLPESANLFSFEKNCTVIDSNDGTVDEQNSLINAQEALEEGNFSCFIVFEEGFQQRLNEKLVTKVGILDNSSAPNKFIGNITEQLIDHDERYVVDNLTLGEFNSLINVSTLGINNLSNDYDYLVVMGDTLNFTIYHRELENIINVYSFREDFINYCINFISYMDDEPIVIPGLVPIVSIEGSIIFPNPAYSIYFLQSVDTTSKSILTQTVNGVFSSFLSNDYGGIEIDVSTKNYDGVVINAITTGTPGYIIYGMLMLMSFITATLSQDAQDGLLQRLKSTKMKDSQLLFGTLIANTIIVLLQFTFAIIILSLYGFSPNYNNFFTLTLGSIFNVIAISFFMSALAFLVVPIFKTPEASGGGVWLFLIPLMMFSGAFFPLELVAPNLVGPARFVPTRMSVLVFQGIMVDGLSLSNPKIWLNLLGQFAYGIVLFFIGVKLFNKFTKKIKTFRDVDEEDKKDK